LGGNNLADVQRLTIVADPSNANGSAFGGIRMGNAVFGGSTGVVGISAANVAVQDVVTIGDLDATGSAIPALSFGSNSQFGSVTIAGGDLLNSKTINNAGYKYDVTLAAGTTSGGSTLPAQNTYAQLVFTQTPASVAANTPNPAPVAQTYVLTVGANGFTGTGAGDTFDGRTNANSLNSADILGGGDGTDVLTAILSQVGGINVRPSLTSIETIEITNSAGNGNGAATVDLANSTGYTTLRSVQSTDDVTFTNVGSTANIEAVLTTQPLTVNYADAALSGNESVNLRLDNVDGIVVTIGNATAGGVQMVETVNALFAANADATPLVSILGDGAANVVLTSSIDATTTAYTVDVRFSADASALTKRINLSTAGAGTLIGGSAADSITGSNGADSIVGGDGNDTINGNGGADTMDGGLGNDTYQFASATTLTAGRISDASGTNTIAMTQSTNGAAANITDAAFVGKTGTATLTLSGVNGNGTNTVTLDDDALAAGITTVNAAANGDTITVTAGYTGAITIVGGAGSDVITSGAGSDRITLGAGVDNVNGGAGDDTVVGGANVTDADILNGGLGTDVLTLNGAGAATTIDFTANANFTGFERISVAAGAEAVAVAGANNDTLPTINDYTLTLAVANVADNSTFTVDASALRTGIITNFGADGEIGGGDDTTTGEENLTLTASALGATRTVSVIGGAGADVITGGAGVDTLDGAGGADTYVFATAADLTAADNINDSGTSGVDTVRVDGAGNVGDAAFLNMRGVEAFTANNAAANTYTLGVNAQAAGITRVTLGAADALAAGAYTVGLTVTASGNNEVITTGAGNDTITIDAGVDSVVAGDGDDTVVGGANVTTADTLTGGAGTDVLTLNAGAAAGANATTTIDFTGSTNFSGFERITVAAGTAAVAVAGVNNDILPSINDYTLTLVDANVAAASTFTVDASALRTAIITNFNDGEIGGVADTTAGEENLSLTASALTGTRAVSVLGGAGVDTVIGGAGADYIAGNGGADILEGRGGNDTILGGDGIDLITGGAGADSLDGGAGDDVFVMSVAELHGDNDTVAGGAGSNTLRIANDGNHTIADVAFNARFTDVATVNFVGDVNGQADTFTWTMGSYSQAAGVRTVTIGANAIGVIDATSFTVAVTLTGGSGNDSLTGSALADSLTGGLGNDTINAGAGNDTITIGAGDDSVVAGDGNDTVIGGANVDLNDVLTGDAGTDVLTLNAGAAAGANATTAINFTGSTNFSGFERITVEAGTAAVSVAGVNNDILPSINDYTLTLVDANVAAASTFTVDASALRTAIITNFNDGEIGGVADTTAGEENLNLTADLTGTRAVSVLGGAGVDTVTGGAGADYIAGNGGADILEGRGGNDTILGGDGNDLITGGAGTDNLTGNAGADTFIFAQVSDSTGAAGDSITDFTTGTDKIRVSISADANINVSGFASVASFNDGLVSLSLAKGDSFYSAADGKLYIDVDGNGTISQDSDYVISTASVVAGDLNFALTGGAAANALTGGAGADTIDGAAGNDAINGGAGNDQLTGGAGTDTFTVASGTDTITDLAAGNEADVLVVGAGASAIATVTGNWAATNATSNSGTATLNLANAVATVDLTNAVGPNGFTVNAGADGDGITGSAQNDTIVGGAGVDIIVGGLGADSIVGGLGADDLTGGGGVDTFVLTSTAATDIVRDMALGVGGDVLQVDVSDLGLAGSDVFVGAVGAVNVNGSQEIVVLTGADYADDAAAATAVANQVTTDGLAMVVVYFNSTDSKAYVIHITNSGTGVGVTRIATLDNVVNLNGGNAGTNLADAVAGNFGGRP
jgi:Ca2+-binding RTX toxin-like protein